MNICIICVADLQLDVKGCPDVYASFDKYVAVEHLDGDNKYQAEQYGLQVITPTGLHKCLCWPVNLNPIDFS